MIKAVLFDLDGTILDTVPDIAGAINYSLRKFGYAERPLAEITSFLGNGAKNLCTCSLPDDDKSRLDEFMAFYNSYYDSHSLELTKPYKGVPEFIDRLRVSGILTAVLSNKPDVTAKRTIAHFFGDKLPAVGQTPEIRRKPAPDGLNKMISEFGLKKEDVLYVGDSEVDVETARNAGVECIAVEWGYRSRETLIKAGAKRIVSSVQELENLIAEMQADGREVQF